MNRRPLRPEANARGRLPPLLLCLTCLAPSMDIRWRPLVSVVVVTHLVTHPSREAVVAGCRPLSHAGSPAWPGVRRLRHVTYAAWLLLTAPSIGPTVFKSAGACPATAGFRHQINSCTIAACLYTVPHDLHAVCTVPHDLHMISIPSPHHPASVGYYVISAGVSLTC